MTINENVARRLLQIVQDVSARDTAKIALIAKTRGEKRARMLETIGQSVLSRRLEFTSIGNGSQTGSLVLEVTNSRVTRMIDATPDTLGDVVAISSGERHDVAQQLGQIVTGFSRCDGDIFALSTPLDHTPDAEDVGITLNELLAVVTVEDLPEDLLDIAAGESTSDDEATEEIVQDVQKTEAHEGPSEQLKTFYDRVEGLSSWRAILSTDGGISQESGTLFSDDLAGSLASDLTEWSSDSGDAISLPQLIVMRPRKGRDEAMALYRNAAGTAVSVHETRKLGSVVGAVKELLKHDDR